MLDQRRLFVLKEGIIGSGTVVYWMSRDQRVADNWAFWYSQDLALSKSLPLVVVFTLCENFLGAGKPHYSFLNEGLAEVEENLKQKNIPLVILHGYPPTTMADFVKKHKTAIVITDFDPLRIKQEWKKSFILQTELPVHEVDAHNIVPCRIASTKQEFGAYTIRPKIMKLLPHFLKLPPQIVPHPYSDYDLDKRSTSKFSNTPVVAGQTAGLKKMHQFIENRLSSYAENRNNPLTENTSGLSSYLHFGHLFAGRVAHEVLHVNPNAKEFLEELIIRRELSDNFCFYNTNYDNTKGFPAWAQETLNKHRNDPRPTIYSLENLEHGQTHDKAWNAAQRQLLATGRMHGYMRMYWGKKILEWTPDAETAMRYAIALNDKYQLDGRDPNGYTGIAWCIGGVHDRPWPERSIFGKIRSMMYSGLRKKINLDSWNEMYPEATSA